MSYIILNGIPSTDIDGLLIQSLPPITKPLMRTQVEEIDGRDGDIITPLGFQSYDKTVRIGLYGDYDVDEVIAYFASEGTVVFSNEPDKYYHYQQLAQINLERLIRFRQADVVFHVQPFKYELDEPVIDESGTVDVSGDIITFEAQAGSHIRVTVPVDPKQDLHGYNKPWIGGANKSLLPYDALETYAGLTLTMLSDGGLRVHGTNNQTTSGVVDLGAGVSLPAGTYRLSGNGGTGYHNRVQIRVRKTGLNYVSGDGTFTLTEETVVKIAMYVGVPSTTEEAQVDYTFYPMVTVSTASTDFVPYANICPITGYTGLTVARTGENLLNVASGLVNSTLIDASTGTVRSNINNTYYCNININESTLINAVINAQPIYLTFSVDDAHGKNLGIVAYGTRTGGQSYKEVNSVAGDTSVTILLDDFESISYIQPRFNRATTPFTDTTTVFSGLRLTIGNTEKPFSTYTIQDYTVSFGGTYYDGIYDGDNGHLVIIKGVATFNGSESWGVETVASGLLNFYLNLSNAGKMTDRRSGQLGTELMMNQFKGEATGEMGTAYVSSGGFLNVKAPFSTVSEWQTFLSNNNLMILYPRDTFNVIDLPVQNITAVQGTNNVFTDIGSINATVPNMMTIINKGNTIARPKLTIYGSGDLSIYLNGLQIFQIALGNTGSITIDSEAMEAYQDGILRNRLVTGDYENLVFQTGENVIAILGNVSHVEISNYSRWL